MTDEIRRLIRDLDGIPPELRRQLRPGLRTAGRIVADQAKINAAWSTRIPKAIKVSVRFSGTPGVRVRVDRRKAPHGRPYEHGGRPGTFRHPYFGDRRRWYSQRARPFLAPAVASKGRRAAREIDRVVARVTRDAGFH
ncbi:HK97 gp10 family phage protein [Actinomadura formosensis]|uniref:HK97 gp10 family phage protein n=1 Tax=Actinomadura formosensis TaxID=60706 RepID=UPI003D8BFCCC